MSGRLSPAVRYACLVWVLSCGVALAQCQTLNAIITLARDNVMAEATFSPDEYARLDTAISRIDNAEMLRLLRASGHSDAFANLRNVLTYLKFIAQSPEAKALDVASPMRRDFDLASQTVEEACTYEKDNPSPARTGTRTGIAGLQKPDALKPRAIARALTPEQEALISRRKQYRQLALFAGAICVAVLVGMLVHAAWLAIRVMRRGRRICRIPARLNWVLDELDGHITILGQKGCRFVPNAPFSTDHTAILRNGAYCSIHVGDDVFKARLFQDSVVDCRMLFGTPLSKSRLNDLVNQSEVPIRYDFQARQMS